MCIRSRGLSVLLRVTSIFTRSAISPSSRLRQRRSRYAIRAGRNLPDKEFRYLRMLIVTTAVYWGLNSELRPEGLTRPLNLPAPGRRQSVYIVLRLRTDPVSYTHLRAHETVLDLVCRLLLEKKKKKKQK